MNALFYTLAVMVILGFIVVAILWFRAGLRQQRVIRRIQRDGVRLEDDVLLVLAALPVAEAKRQIQALFEKADENEVRAAQQAAHPAEDSSC